MPRKPRELAHNNVYHCMMRGINQQDIFYEDKDYLKFQELIFKSKKKFLFKLYSYVLMPNHIHLEIKDENKKISQIIHLICTNYANYFNKKYQRKGHLFENRFKSKNVENSNYVLNLVRYIHQNPIKAGIGKMNEYKWSSYSEYFDIENLNNQNKMVDTKEILAMFSPDINKAREFFLEYNEKMIKFNESINLLEYEMKNNLTDEEVIYFIENELNISNIQKICQYDTQYRNEIIKKIKNIKGTTQPQLSRVLGIDIKLIRKAIYNS